MSENCVIYAALYNGKDYGEAATGEVSNIDTTDPTSCTFTVDEVTADSIKVTATASDATGIKYFDFSSDGGSTYPAANRQTIAQVKPGQASKEFTFTGLDDNTSYTIKVKAIDEAGNPNESEITSVTTLVNKTLSDLRAGEYVVENGNPHYSIPGGTPLFYTKSIVMYDSTEEDYDVLGVQAVACNSPFNISLLDVSNFNTAVTSYNNAIDTLNSKAEICRTSSCPSIFSDARCLGSLPSNKSSKNSSWYNNSDDFFTDYNRRIQQEDTNYNRDLTALQENSIVLSASLPWLASRGITYVKDTLVGFGVRLAFKNEVYNTEELGRVVILSSGLTELAFTNRKHDIVPVFTINPNTVILGGSGTENDPYRLAAD